MWSVFPIFSLCDHRRSSIPPLQLTSPSRPPTNSSICRRPKDTAESRRCWNHPSSVFDRHSLSISRQGVPNSGQSIRRRSPLSLKSPRLAPPSQLFISSGSSSGSTFRSNLVGGFESSTACRPSFARRITPPPISGEPDHRRVLLPGRVQQRRRRLRNRRIQLEAPPALSLTRLWPQIRCIDGIPLRAPPSLASDPLHRRHTTPSTEPPSSISLAPRSSSAIQLPSDPNDDSLAHHRRSKNDDTSKRSSSRSVHHRFGSNRSSSSASTRAPPPPDRITFSPPVVSIGTACLDRNSCGSVFFDWNRGEDSLGIYWIKKN